MFCNVHLQEIITVTKPAACNGKQMIYNVTMRNYFISYYHKKNRAEYLHDKQKNPEIPNVTQCFFFNLNSY